MFRRKRIKYERARMNDADHRKLFEIIEKYKADIYAMRTDNETNRKKRLAWIKITEDFNKDPKQKQKFPVQKLINHFRNSPAEIRLAQKEGRELPLPPPIPPGYYDSGTNDSSSTSSSGDVKTDFDGENASGELSLDVQENNVDDNMIDLQPNQQTDFVSLPDMHEGVLKNTGELNSQKKFGNSKSYEKSRNVSELYRKIVSPAVKTRLHFHNELQRQKVKLNELNIKREELKIQMLKDQLKQGRQNHVNKLQRDQELHTLQIKHEQELHELQMQIEREKFDGRYVVDYNNKTNLDNF